MANRSGRKSNPAAKRRQTTRDGRGYDVGPTPEAFVKKAMMLDMDLGNYGAIMTTDASCPLAVLEARKIITEDQRRAGDEFAWLFWRGFAKPHAKTGSLSDRVSSGLASAPPEYDPEADAKLELVFKNMHCELKRIGSREYDAFAGPVLEQEWAPWFFRYIEGRYVSWQSQALLRGLNVLVQIRTGNRKYG